MKSLQIVVPFQTCPFKCPFCIANNPKVETAFDNLYATDEDEYFNQLIDIILNEQPKTVVITGDTEPTLNIEWVIKVANIVKFVDKRVQIELQTKNFNAITMLRLRRDAKIDLFAYSIDTNAQVEKAKNAHCPTYLQETELQKTSRATLLLNRNLNLDELNLGNSFKQVTVKYLQMGDNETINKWICDNSFTNHKSLNEFIKRHSHLSVMVDENCMVSENRYQIFRSDGKLYDTWTDLPKIG